MLPFNYSLADTELQVRLGPLLVRKIAYSDIEGVEERYSFWNEHWTNFWPWRFLTVRRKSGLLRNFVINPQDRELFAGELRVRLSRSRVL